MARAGASKFDQRDAWRRDNADALRAACTVSRARYSDALNVLNALTARAKPDGRVSESVAQVVEVTGVTEAQVRRALDALTAVGALETVERGRSSGAGGGKGRPSVRVLLFMTVIEAATGDPEGLGITQNDRALMRDRPRTNEGMSAHLSALPHGLSSTELPTPVARDADAEPAAGNREGGNDAHKGKEQPPCSRWEAMVCTATAERLYAHDERNGRTKSVRDPEAVKRSKANTVLPHLRALQTRYARLDGLTHRDSAWPELLTVLACMTTGESATLTTWEALDPYRLALAASDG